MKYLFVLGLSLGFLTVRSQNLHADLFGGIANYQGDLQEKIFTFNMAHPAVGFGLAYDVSGRLIARTGLTYGTVEGNDKNNSRDKGIQQRNLSFKTHITELHAGLEFNLFDLSVRSFTPYIFAGVAVYHYNPFTFDSAGNKVFLKPLSTEGEGLPQYPDRKPYNLTQLSLPVGGGLKIELSDNLEISGEIAWRKLFTDYLDDVSKTYVDQNVLLAAKGPQAVSLAYRGNEIGSGPYPADGTMRGNSKHMDWYYFGGLRLRYRLNSGNGWGGGGHGGGKSKTGCPGRIY